jgi:hypothetical protein
MDAPDASGDASTLFLALENKRRFGIEFVAESPVGSFPRRKTAPLRRAIDYRSLAAGIETDSAECTRARALSTRSRERAPETRERKCVFLGGEAQSS